MADEVDREVLSFTGPEVHAGMEALEAVAKTHSKEHPAMGVALLLMTACDLMDRAGLAPSYMEELMERLGGPGSAAHLRAHTSVLDRSN